MKTYCISILLIFWGCITGNAQPESSADSLLLKKYWDRIYPISVDSKHDFLYSAIDNNLIVCYPDNDTIRKYEALIKTHNGKIFKTEDGWLTIPQNAGRSFITTYIITLDKDTLMIGKKVFTVKNLPYPVLKISNSVISDSVLLDRKVFLSGDSLQLFFTDDLPESDSWYQVKNFTIGYSYGGIYLSLDNDGPYFSAKSLDMIRKVPPGQEMVIKVTGVSPSQVLRFLPLIRFRVY